MKTLLNLGILTLGLMTPLSKHAEAATDFRLGVIDFQRALLAVEEGKSAKAKLQKEAEGRQKDIEARGAKLEKLQKDIEELHKQAQSNIVKPEVMEKGRKMEMDFQKQLMEYRQLGEKNLVEMKKKEDSATEEILKKMKVIVDEIASAGGFTLVLEKTQSGIIYASHAVTNDLTDETIRKYNVKFKGTAGKASLDTPAKEAKEDKEKK